MNCYACGQPALPTLSQHLRTCQPHRDALIVDKPKMRVHWLKKPGCPVCGNEKYKQSGYCKTHRDEKRAEQSERRRNGLGNKTQRRVKNRATVRGNCPSCDKRPVTGKSSYCAECKAAKDKERRSTKPRKLKPAPVDDTPAIRRVVFDYGAAFQQEKVNGK